MDEKVKARLEARGWKVGSTEEFLGLTPEEAIEVELRLKRNDELREAQCLFSSRGSQRQPRRGGKH